MGQRGRPILSFTLTTGPRKIYKLITAGSLLFYPLQAVWTQYTDHAKTRHCAIRMQSTGCQERFTARTQNRSAHTHLNHFFLGFRAFVFTRAVSIHCRAVCIDTEIGRFYPGPTRRHRNCGKHSLSRANVSDHTSFNKCGHYPNSFEKQLEARGIEE